MMHEEITVQAPVGHCRKCGKQIDIEAVVCPHCGVSQLTIEQFSSQTNGFAVASMVLGIVWFMWLGSILAVIFGHIALSQIKRSKGRQSGRGIALTGVILGWIGVAVLVLYIGIFASLIGGSSEFMEEFTREFNKAQNV